MFISFSIRCFLSFCKIFDTHIVLLFHILNIPVK
nr:MAG TPA: hypothetical protein [Caudoviricetes sp.]DAY15989.1 MAG TPA: hypothetical protein [Caudoviricetes sp.]